METIDAFIKFLGSYPLWAKLLAVGGLFTTAATLALAPRHPTTSKDSSTASAFLTISSVKLFPANPNAEVQIIAYVNGSKFQYPSIAGITWLKVGPGMSPQIIEIPTAERYETRFELNLKLPDGIKRLVSQTVLPISELPFTADYKLHPVAGETREAAVGAVVSFSLAPNP